MDQDDRIRVGDAGQQRDETPRIRQVTNLTRATDTLLDNWQIFRGRIHHVHGRYVELCRQALFDSLVALYTIQIKAQFAKFADFIEAYTEGPDLAAYAAQCYISCWFHDLYVSNSASLSRSRWIPYPEHYRHDEFSYLDEYDNFLSTLNSHIRPTIIHGAMEETLWIPVIHFDPDWTDPNPFQITNYDANDDLARGLVMIMKDTDDGHWNWITQPLSTVVTGRPSWLFDWFTESGIERAYAWFPKEGNYTDEDVTIACIVGVACTPKLAPRDVDDWQTWTNNSPPAQIEPRNLRRVVDRRWFGAIDVRTVEERIQYLYFPGPTPATPGPVTRSKNDEAGKASATTLVVAMEASTKGATTEGTTSANTFELVEANQFQITDWTYYLNVIDRTVRRSRTRALESLNLNF